MKKLRVLALVAVAAVAAAFAAYALRPKSYVIVEIPGATYTLPFAVNDAGSVLIGSMDSAGMPEAYLWERGRLTHIGSFTPFAINNRGDVVGVDSAGPVIWRSRTLFKVSGAGSNVVPIGIDDTGTVYLYSDSLTGVPNTARIWAWRNGAASRICDCPNIGKGFLPKVNTAGMLLIPVMKDGGAIGMTIVDHGKRFVVPLSRGSREPFPSAFGPNGEVAYDPNARSEAEILWTPKGGTQTMAYPMGSNFRLSAFLHDGSAIGSGGVDSIGPIHWKNGRTTNLPTKGLDWGPTLAASDGLVAGILTVHAQKSLADKLFDMFHIRNHWGGSPEPLPVNKTIIWSAGTLPL